MKVQVTEHTDEDILSGLATVEDLEQMMAKRVASIIKEHPMEIAKDMKDSGAIDDEQYKQMVINIRKAKAEGDFSNE